MQRNRIDILCGLVLEGCLHISKAARWRLIEQSVLLLNEFGFVLAASPTISPITDKKFETKGINLHAGLEADAEVPEIHLVLVGVSKEQAEVACDGEEEVVVEGRQVREFVNKKLRDLLGALTFTGNPFLSLFGKEFVGQFSKPSLEH